MNERKDREAKVTRFSHARTAMKICKAIWGLVSHSTLRIRPLVCSLIGDWVKWKRASATRRIRDPEVSFSLIRWTSNWHIKFETRFTPVVWRYSKTWNQTTEREKRSTSDCCFWSTGRQHSRCFIYLPMPRLRWKSHANGSAFLAHRAVLRMRKRNFRPRSFVSCCGPSHVLRVRKSVYKRRWVGGVSWVWQLPSQSDSDYIRKLFVMHEWTERWRSFFGCCFLSCCCFRWNFGVRDTQNTISKVSTAALIMIKCKM